MPRRAVSAFLSVLACVLLATMVALSAGCSGSSASSTEGGQSQGDASGQTSGTSAIPDQGGTGMYTPAYKPNGKETAVIKTSKGTIEVEFYSKDAPVAVANFIELSEKGYYDGVKFHRYVPGFVIQGGDPQTKNATSEQVAQAAASGSGPFGTGGPGYTIVDEYAHNPNKHVDGSLAMARTGAPNSAGSQFYFALEPLPQLDGQYTVFGQATKGLDVIHALRAGDVIESITIENATK